MVIDMKKNIEILKSEINIGIREPFRVLQITDSHVVYDHPGKPTDRNEVFSVDYDRCWDDYLTQALRYAKENNLTIIHTGDIIDFISEDSLSYIKEKLEDVDYILAPGNHDYIHCWGEAEETDEYKEKTSKLIAPYISNNLHFYSRVINGVNFVVIDDSYYKITKAQLDMLKAEVAAGLPVVVCMHIPLYSPSFAVLSMEKWVNCTHLLAPEEEMLKKYSEKRMKQQKADAITLEAAEYIKKEPLIKAVIAGHIHLNFEDMISDTCKQISTDGSYCGYVREIYIR